MRKPSIVAMSITVLMLVTSTSNPAAAQDPGVAKGGLLGFGAADDYTAIAVGGVHAGAIVHVMGPVAIYNNFNYSPDAEARDRQGGAPLQLHLAPSDWVVLPSIRQGLPQDSGHLPAGGSGFPLGQPFGGWFVGSGGGLAVLYPGVHAGF